MSFCFLYNVVSENYSVQNSPLEGGEGGLLPAQGLYHYLQNAQSRSQVVGTFVTRGDIWKIRQARAVLPIHNSPSEYNDHLYRVNIV